MLVLKLSGIQNDFDFKVNLPAVEEVEEGDTITVQCRTQSNPAPLTYQVQFTF